MLINHTSFSVIYLFLNEAIVFVLKKYSKEAGQLRVMFERNKPIFLVKSSLKLRSLSSQNSLEVGT